MQKHQNFDPFLVGHSRFAAEILFNIRALKSKLPLNVEITPHKLAFCLEVTNQEFLSHTGGTTGSVFFKMAAAILDFDKLLPFVYYWTNPHQVWWECCESDIERNCRVNNAHLPKLKISAAAILILENCCHRFTIRPILAKFDGNVANLI